MAPKSGARPTKKISLRSFHEIFLIGNCESDILGAKLPSKKQVLQLFFYERRVEDKPIKESLKIAVDAALKLWEKARIPHMTEKSCIQKVEKLYEKWKILQKHKNTPFEKHRREEKEFKEHIEDYIFDFAAPDALNRINIKEDRDFLLLQRQKGRPGSMASCDIITTQKEIRREKRLTEERERFKKYQDKISATASESVADTSTEDDNDFVADANVETAESPKLLRKEKSCGKIQFIDDRMLASMDKCKISSRNAMHLVSATVS